LAERGEVIAHGIAPAARPHLGGGRIGNTPVVVLPGAPDQAFAAWWTLALPALDRLSGRRPRKTLGLPLARKIASQVGIAEIVLLERKEGAWITLALGNCRWSDRPRGSLACCPGGSEGFAAGARSMPICSGNDKSVRMTNAKAPLPGK
jgi:hypothetical protein